MPITNTHAKILDTIYKKLCDGFETKFLPRRQFEKEFATNSKFLLDTLTQLIGTYYELKNNGDKEILKLTRDEYILQQFNSRHYSYSYSSKFTNDNLPELKNKEEWNYNNYSAQYDRYFEDDSEVIVSISLITFLKEKIQEIISETENNADLTVKNIFWDYFRETHLNKEYIGSYEIRAIKNSPDKIIEKFNDHYLSNKYLRLLDKAEQKINAVDFSGFETPIVNVGLRAYETARSGWTTNYFKVINNEKKYSFTSSSKDEKLIEGEFVNIFFLQFQKKRLLKISITLDGTEQIYIGDRDFEKVSLKDDGEVLIAKHYGNETIIFETEKEATEFQEKVFEMKHRQKNYR